MELTNYNDKNLFEEGKRVLQTNPTLFQVVNFMEHPVSREFYDRWIKSNEFDTMRYFLWIYEQLEHHTQDLLPIERVALMEQITRSGAVLHELTQYYNTQHQIEN